MEANNTEPKTRHILCPSDLSEKSQKALGFAARLAETLDASLTACHCAPANWFGQEHRLLENEVSRIRDTLKNQIVACESESSRLTWRSVVVENSFDAAHDVLALTREADVDLIVLKARPSVLSAFRFGSIVERIVESAPCPTLILPSQFLAGRDPAVDPLEFRRVLFDYDFSEATDQLFQTANDLARDYRADLHVLSVLAPSNDVWTEASPAGGRTYMRTMARRRLGDALRSEGKSVTDVRTVVEWGPHAETVLKYAKDHQIDLICTTLDPPHYYFEKLYSTHLGSLLKWSSCPILVKQSSKVDKLRDFPS